MYAFSPHHRRPSAGIGWCGVLPPGRDTPARLGSGCLQGRGGNRECRALAGRYGALSMSPMRVCAVHTGGWLRFQLRRSARTIADGAGCDPGLLAGLFGFRLVPRLAFTPIPACPLNAVGTRRQFPTLITATFCASPALTAAIKKVGPHRYWFLRPSIRIA